MIRERDFYPQALLPFRWGGALMCIPQNLSSLAVYYNRDPSTAPASRAPPTTERGTTSSTPLAR
jgi:multiple sugar transport system substrate-binding protein